MSNSSWIQKRGQFTGKIAALGTGETGEYKESQFMEQIIMNGNSLRNQHLGNKDGMVIDKLQTRCKGPSQRTLPGA